MVLSKEDILSWVKVEKNNVEDFTSNTVTVNGSITSSEDTVIGYDGSGFFDSNPFVDTGVFPSTSSFSVSLWVKNLGNTSGGSLVEEGLWSVGDSNLAYLSNKIIFEGFGDIAYSNIIVDGSSNFVTDNIKLADLISNPVWVHLVYVYTSTSAKLYRNGVEISNDTFSGISGVPSGQGFTFGRAYNRNSIGTYNADNGLVQQAVFIDKAVSTGEISTLYNGGSGVQYIDLFSTTSVGTGTTTPFDIDNYGLTNSTGLIVSRKNGDILTSYQFIDSSGSSGGALLTGRLTQAVGDVLPYRLDEIDTPYEDLFSIPSFNPPNSVFPQGIAWKPDGFNFVLCNADKIKEFSCDNGFDVISGSSTGNTLNTQNATCTGISWADGGSLLFEIGYTGLYEYTGTVDYELGFRSYSGKSFTSLTGNYPEDVVWKPDGTKFYVMSNSTTGLSGNTCKVREYDCSSAFDITTASYNNVSITCQNQSGGGIDFNKSGTRLIEVGSNDRLYEWDLGSAWDLSTAVYNNVNIASETNNPSSIEWGNKGHFLYEVDEAGDQVVKKEINNGVAGRIEIRNLGTPFDSSTTLKYALSDNFLQTVYDFNQSSEGLYGVAMNDSKDKVYALTNNSTLVTWDLTISGDLTSNTSKTTFNISSNSGSEISFLQGGSVMVVTYSGDKVEVFDLSTPFDVSTRTSRGVKNTGRTSSFLFSCTFNNDGTKAVLSEMQGGGTELVSGDCSTPFDISTFTATGTKVFSGDVYGVLETPSGLSINSYNFPTNTLSSYGLSTELNIEESVYVGRKKESEGSVGIEESVLVEPNNTKQGLLSYDDDVVIGLQTTNMGGKNVDTSISVGTPTQSISVSALRDTNVTVNPDTAFGVRYDTNVVVSTSSDFFVPVQNKDFHNVVLDEKDQRSVTVRSNNEIVADVTVYTVENAKANIDNS